MCSAGGADQPREDGSQIESAVEQVLDLREVAMSVLGKAEGVIRAGQCSLQIAQNRVDGLELGQFDAGGSAAGDRDLMHAGVPQDREAGQSVGDHACAVVRFFDNVKSSPLQLSATTSAPSLSGKP